MDRCIAQFGEKQYFFTVKCDYVTTNLFKWIPEIRNPKMNGRFYVLNVRGPLYHFTQSRVKIREMSWMHTFP